MMDELIFALIQRAKADPSILDSLDAETRKAVEEGMVE